MPTKIGAKTELLALLEALYLDNKQLGKNLACAREGGQGGWLVFKLKIQEPRQ
jgi:hypothetical protein